MIKYDKQTAVCPFTVPAAAHLEVLNSRGVLCSVAEDRGLIDVPTTVLQQVIKGLKVCGGTETHTHVHWTRHYTTAYTRAGHNRCVECLKWCVQRFLHSPTGRCRVSDVLHAGVSLWEQHV